MAKKKARTQDKADAFLAGLGTSGGAIGSPGLVAFGAGDIERQVITGNMDNHFSIKDPEISAAPMPQDLDSSYLKLNLPGSPLPGNALTSVQNLEITYSRQKAFLAGYQQQLLKGMPPEGNYQLPVGLPPINEKGRRK